MIKTHDKLNAAIESETKKFKELYLWLESAMPKNFIEILGQENALLVAHNLIGFDLQNYFSTIHLKGAAVVICLDSEDADIRILKNYSLDSVLSYETFISSQPVPVGNVKTLLRIAILHFIENVDANIPLSKEIKKAIYADVKNLSTPLEQTIIDQLLEGISPRFLRTLDNKQLGDLLSLCNKAKDSDSCQYHVVYNENWKKENKPSLQIVLAWKNVPKHLFFYRIARIIYRHNLVMKRVNATYLNPYSSDSILLMSLDIHGLKNKAAWDVADISDFLRELATCKYFSSMDKIEEVLVDKNIISGNMGNLLRSMIYFIHQALVPLDSNIYTLETIEEAFCRHPELTVLLCEAFEAKFDPKKHSEEVYQKIRQHCLSAIQKLDTGQVFYDTRRRNVLRQAANMIHYTLKTNFYCSNFTALGFRIDPSYLDEVPYPFERKDKFPMLPYGIFYIKGRHFFGFHIRFKDLARGGLRTIALQQAESEAIERNHVFSECYNLAFTQHMKNKDIPEGGSKGVIFLKPFDKVFSEANILEKELELQELNDSEIENKITSYKQELKLEHLYQAQRCYVESLVSLVNCESDGTLRQSDIVDYWKRPEYIYLGPDENITDTMIKWIADYSEKQGYKPGSSFMSGKPLYGINHKEYGVTSKGVNVYMEEVLKFIGIDPKKDKFSIKMSGGPDGDVAGNEIVNLYHYYPKTAKLLALTDVTGTINDPEGLDLETLVSLFKKGLGIRFYPAEKLHKGGFLLDKYKTRNLSAYEQQTLLSKNMDGELVEEWISGSDMNALLRNNVHQTITDVFIPSGGRPRTLNEGNYKEFLDETGKPTAKAIVEGANLYLTQGARRLLENLGVLIIKDSSANKGGVICSSYEILSGLTLGDEKFLENKEELVKEILERIQQCSLNEANLLLKTHQDTGQPLTLIADKISEHINQFTYQLLDYLDKLTLANDPKDPFILCYLDYCLPNLRKNVDLLLSQIPEHHKKAIMACHIAANLVYKKGLSWYPSVVDILPVLLAQFDKHRV